MDAAAANRNLKILLNFLGIVTPNQRRLIKSSAQAWYLSYVVSVLIIITSHVLDLIYHENGFNTMQVSGVAFMILLHFQIIWMNHRTTVVLRMFEIRTRDFLKAYENRPDRFSRFLSKFGYKLCVFYVLAITASPFIKFVSNRRDFSSLVFYAWQPWRIDGPATYCLTYGIQFIVTTITLITANIFVLFLIYVCSEIKIQKSTCNSSIRNIAKLSRRNRQYIGNRGDSDSDDERMVSSLIEQFNRYRILHR